MFWTARHITRDLKTLWKPQVIIRTQDLLTFSKLPLNVMRRTQHFITFDLKH